MSALPRTRHFKPSPTPWNPSSKSSTDSTEAKRHSSTLRRSQTPQRVTDASSGRPRRLTKRFLFVPLVFLASVALLYQVCFVENEGNLKDGGDGATVVLWWTPFGSDGVVRDCGASRCLFTQNRSYLDHPRLSALMFYGSAFDPKDLPPRRTRSTLWALMHEESPRNNPVLVHEEALGLFNYSATFSRHSDLPLTLLDAPGEEELVGTKYFVPTWRKNQLMSEENLAPLLYIQSDCDTASDRDSYVSELMKHIRVDSYGACLNNARLDDRFRQDYLNSLTSEEFLSFVARYKFTLALENAVCEDYVTEKLWRPLTVGSVPVYYGSPSFQDWLPTNSSALSVQDFPSPKALAERLEVLLSSDEAYEVHLAHKLSGGPLANARLRQALSQRPEGGRGGFGAYVEAFECLLCSASGSAAPKVAKMLRRAQYDCPIPRSPLDGAAEGNHWAQQWRLAHEEAKGLSERLRRRYGGLEGATEGAGEP